MTMPSLNRCWNRVAGLGLVVYLAATNLTSNPRLSWSASSRKLEDQFTEKSGSFGINGVQHHQRSWKSTAKSDSVQEEWFFTQQTPPAIKIILLWDGTSLELLQHDLRSLHAAHYNGDKIDVEVQMSTRKDLSEHRLTSFRNDLEWDHGDVHMVLWKEQNDETLLRDRIRQVWQPTSDEERVIMFHVDNHSNQHPHEQWYQWLKQMHAKLRDDPRPDIAGFGLSTKQLHERLSANRLLSSSQEPFLFPEINFYGGFAPTATAWQEFIDYVDCVQRHQLEIDQHTKDKSHFWNDVEKLWGDYASTKGSHHLYQFPNGKTLFSQDDLVGQHSRKVRKPTMAPSAPSVGSIGSLVAYRYKHANRTELVQVEPAERTLRTLVMSSAMGYPLDTFREFVGSLRKFYNGDVVLSINATITDEIAAYLQGQNIKAMVQPEITGSDPEAKARDRFTFFGTICTEDKYDLCLHTDFGDSIFQANPFAEFHDNQDIFRIAHMQQQHLFIYQHEMIMNPWHFRKMAACGIYDAYGKHVAGKWILSSGSIIASPLVWKELGHYNRLWSNCNDQIVYNAWVYTPYDELLPEHQYSEHVPNATMHFHRQGDGAVNVVEGGGFVHKDSKDQFLSRNCLPSPVVHQHDRVK